MAEYVCSTSPHGSDNNTGWRRLPGTLRLLEAEQTGRRPAPRVQHATRLCHLTQCLLYVQAGRCMGVHKPGWKRTRKYTEDEFRIPEFLNLTRFAAWTHGLWRWYIKQPQIGNRPGTGCVDAGPCDPAENLLHGQLHGGWIDIQPGAHCVDAGP